MTFTSAMINSLCYMPSTNRQTENVSDSLANVVGLSRVKTDSWEQMETKGSRDESDSNSLKGCLLLVSAAS